jgi:hypothetical protein
MISCTEDDQEVIGDAVELPNTEGEVFAVHYNPLGPCTYTVSHVETGMAIAHGDDIDFVIDNAQKYMSKKTPSEIRDRLIEARKIIAERREKRAAQWN